MTQGGEESMSCHWSGSGKGMGTQRGKTDGRRGGGREGGRIVGKEGRRGVPFARTGPLPSRLPCGSSSRRQR